MKKMLKVMSVMLLSLQPLALSAMTLEEAVKMPHRQDNTARDQYRHPVETLEFFDVKPDMSVVEIWPGQGWYTEILAPYLKEKGHFYAAHFDDNSTVEFFKKSRTDFEAKMKKDPALYDHVQLTEFTLPDQLIIEPNSSVDRILTFRNIHNWYMNGGGDEGVTKAFQAFYKALKPGGILGVVEHRLPADRDLKDQQTSGYMSEKEIIRLAEIAGFKFDAKSEINANKKDIADHPAGVWTLPPSLKLGDKDRQHYIDIGESDRMTLRFKKPELN